MRVECECVVILLLNHPEVFDGCRFILTNNYLFQLAERPPKDMAALLSIFKTVPPLVRRRARELLDLIQETLKVDREDRAAIETPSMQDSMTTTEVREADVEVTTIATDVLESKLWSNGLYSSYLIF